MKIFVGNLKVVLCASLFVVGFVFPGYGNERESSSEVKPALQTLTGLKEVSVKKVVEEAASVAELADVPETVGAVAPRIRTVVDGVAPASKELIDSASYMAGVNVGAMLRGWGVETLDDVNLAEIKKGLEDFFAAKGTQDPRNEEFASQFKYNLTNFDRILNDFIGKNMAYKAAVVKKKEREFFAENAKKPDVSTTDSGLQYTIVAPGAEYKVQPQDTVVVNYKGELLDGTVFDQNDGVEFAADRVISGWTEGLGLIGEGGKIKLYIPSELGYGERGNYAIPPHSTLIFDIEIVEVKQCASENY